MANKNNYNMINKCGSLFRRILSFGYVLEVELNIYYEPTEMKHIARNPQNPTSNSQYFAQYSDRIGNFKTPTAENLKKNIIFRLPLILSDFHWKPFKNPQDFARSTQNTNRYL